MFFPEHIERDILHNSTSKRPFTNQPLIKSQYERTVGGSSNGVKVLHGGNKATVKRKPTVWQTLIKNTMKDQGLNMKEAIKYIKDNKLY
jgi:hypothetical protein